jgi:hypothetical protein
MADNDTSDPERVTERAVYVALLFAMAAAGVVLWLMTWAERIAS